MFDLGVKRNWKSLKRCNVCVQNYIIPVAYLGLSTRLVRLVVGVVAEVQVNIYIDRKATIAIRSNYI